MKYISNINDAAEHKTRSSYKGDEDHREWVITKPIEATGLLKWKIRFHKAKAVFLGKADAFTYSD
jgi:hypothetical protein